MKNLNQNFIFVIIFTLLSNLSLAQVPPAGGGGGEGGGEMAGVIEDSLGDLSLVAYAGVGGAVLGLSTLSFVDEPSEHLKNIIVGGAIGIIVGVAFVAYKQAMSTSTEYNDTVMEAEIDFSTPARIKWASSNSNNYHKPLGQSLGWTFNF